MNLNYFKVIISRTELIAFKRSESQHSQNSSNRGRSKYKPRHSSGCQVCLLESVGAILGNLRADSTSSIMLFKQVVRVGLHRPSQIKLFIELDQEVICAVTSVEFSFDGKPDVASVKKAEASIDILALITSRGNVALRCRVVDSRVDSVRLYLNHISAWRHPTISKDKPHPGIVFHIYLKEGLGLVFRIKSHLHVKARGQLNASTWGCLRRCECC